MTAQDTLIRFSDLPWETPAKYVRQKTRTLTGKKLRLVEFSMGLEHPEWCLKGHVGYVLDGTLAIEFDHGTIEYRAGDGLILPSGEGDRHRPVPVSERVLLVLCEDVS
jgi:quercetin dioxygenase-like cupin family protein